LQEARDQTRFGFAGLARESEYDADISWVSNPGATVERAVKALTVNMTGCGLNKVSSNGFDPERGWTVVRFATCELGIAALQIKVNRKYRVPNQNPQGFCRILAALLAGVKNFTEKIK